MAAKVLAISRSKLFKVMGLQVHTAYRVDTALKAKADRAKGKIEKPLR